MTLYLCLDQGGHASRALVLDECGEVVTRALRDIATFHPTDDRVEHDAEELVASVRDATGDALRNLDARAHELRAAGLATQRSSIVCWDRITGAALSPVISWQDRRAREWLTQFSSCAPDVEQRTGLKLSPHYGASKLRWCLDNLEPVQRARHANRLAFGPLASFLAFRLLDERPLVVDPSNAQRTLLWNVAQRAWDDTLLERFGIPCTVLPECVTTHHAFGHLRHADDGIPLTVLTGDQAAAVFAFGAPRADSAYVNLGTGAFVQRMLDRPQHVDGLLTGIVRVQGDAPMYTLEGTVNGAGAALTWASNTLGLTDAEAQLPQWLARDVELPLFLNGVGGLGAPYWVADFPSRFVGAGEPWQKLVAVSESIVFLIATNIERMRQAGDINALVLSGGLAQLDALCQRLADVTGLPALRPCEHEATARGLAWLLASDKTRWGAIDSVTFSPQPAPALLRRYRNWLVAMADAYA